MKSLKKLKKTFIGYSEEFSNKRKNKLISDLKESCDKLRLTNYRIEDLGDFYLNDILFQYQKERNQFDIAFNIEKKEKNISFLKKELEELEELEEYKEAGEKKFENEYESLIKKIKKKKGKILRMKNSIKKQEKKFFDLGGGSVESMRSFTNEQIEIGKIVNDLKEILKKEKEELKKIEKENRKILIKFGYFGNVEDEISKEIKRITRSIKNMKKEIESLNKKIFTIKDFMNFFNIYENHYMISHFHFVLILDGEIGEYEKDMLGKKISADSGREGDLYFGTIGGQGVLFEIMNQKEYEKKIDFIKNEISIDINSFKRNCSKD